jgi:hypothetical protein
MYQFIYMNPLRVTMASKYLKIKTEGKWTFVPIRSMIEEYAAKARCECKRCKR